jgi:ABC-type ATPase with predicted acetyltransferase domain
VTSRTPLLAARGTGRRFGKTAALEPIELEIWEGDALALVGPNGAGKSTLLSLLAGALVALPLLAAGRAIWEFFSERVALEPWQEGGTIPVEVEIEEPRPMAPVPPSDPPAAASR